MFIRYGLFDCVALFSGGCCGWVVWVVWLFGVMNGLVCELFGWCLL